MAKKVKSQARPKDQTRLKEQTQKFLAKVPGEYVFWCCSGSVFRDMERNDFCN